jgi:flagellar biosynthesis/type III secretory pathway M-ring protein FliF/YscJ
MSLLKQVITSWQVIAVTIAIVIYISIVSSVARTRRRPHLALKKPKAKKKKAASTAEGPEEVTTGSNSNDELGLEEA